MTSSELPPPPRPAAARRAVGRRAAAHPPAGADRRAVAHQPAHHRARGGRPGALRRHPRRQRCCSAQAVDIPGIVIGFVFTLQRTLGWWFRTYTVTDTAVILDEGILQKRHRVVPFSRIQQVELRQQLTSRLFGIVTVHIETAGDAGATAISLRSLDLHAAEALRDHLLAEQRRVRAGLPAGAAGHGRAVDRGLPRTDRARRSSASRTDELLLAGVTSSAAVTIAVLAAVPGCGLRRPQPRRAPPPWPAFVALRGRAHAAHRRLRRRRVAAERLGLRPHRLRRRPARHAGAARPPPAHDAAPPPAARPGDRQPHPPSARDRERRALQRRHARPARPAADGDLDPVRPARRAGRRARAVHGIGALAARRPAPAHRRSPGAAPSCGAPRSRSRSPSPSSCSSCPAGLVLAPLALLGVPVGCAGPPAGRQRARRRRAGRGVRRPRAPPRAGPGRAGAEPAHRRVAVPAPVGSRHPPPRRRRRPPRPRRPGSRRRGGRGRHRRAPDGPPAPTGAGVSAPDWLDELPLQPGPPWLTMATRNLELVGWLGRRRGPRTRSRAQGRAAGGAPRRGVRRPRHARRWAPRPSRCSSSCSRPPASRSSPADLHPLDAAGRLVQEDLCLMVLRDGAPHLDAASLCFPSYWRLADKLGRPMADVHGPVAHYADELAAKVDTFLQRLRPERPVWRRNWSIHDDPTYFLPDPTPPARRRPARRPVAPQRAPDAAPAHLGRRRCCSRSAPSRCRSRCWPSDPTSPTGWPTPSGPGPPPCAAYKGDHGALAAEPWLRSL